MHQNRLTIIFWGALHLILSAEEPQTEVRQTSKGISLNALLVYKDIGRFVHCLCLGQSFVGTGFASHQNYLFMLPTYCLLLPDRSHGFIYFYDSPREKASQCCTHFVCLLGSYINRWPSFGVIKCGTDWTRGDISIRLRIEVRRGFIAGH